MDEQKRGTDELQIRIALGAAVGITAGVVLFLISNSWAMVAVGVVLGLITAAVPSGRSRPEENGPPADPR
ncbi:hypothetical protein GHK92_16240 [Nocardioides sp. dk4132]|uniref:hypothetical protein n=1 Tax=unclassified Nocardioides TaxID=2615069 RepID=UPI001297C525|nr:MULTISPECIES: hypothetical protein [unclassified Nocardioides]MQW77424.1 hypothetical protein [Nocardioides sp. dk4132]QGA09232.1 hypothetical protein GFH29_18925 [Nocardioides sp. dk884]